MTTLPLKRIASVRVSDVDKKSVEGEPPVRLCNYTDVYYRDEIEPGQAFMVATASPEQIAAFRLQPGDVIITKDSETADDIAVPAYVRATASDLICGYHLATCFGPIHSCWMAGSSTGSCRPRQQGNSCPLPRLGSPVSVSVRTAPGECWCRPGHSTASGRSPTTSTPRPPVSTSSSRQRAAELSVRLRDWVRPRKRRC